MSTDTTDMPAGEAALTRALTGLVRDLEGFRAGIETKLEKQEERMTKLHTKSIHAAARPALGRAAQAEAPHQKAFEAYVR